MKSDPPSPFGRVLFWAVLGVVIYGVGAVVGELWEGYRIGTARDRVAVAKSGMRSLAERIRPVLAAGKSLQLASHPAAGGHRQLGAGEWLALGADPMADPFTGQPMALQTEGKGFLLYSTGPDGDFDLPLAGLFPSGQDQPPDPVVLQCYDPTNGTLSGGDVYRWESGL